MPQYTWTKLVQPTWSASEFSSTFASSCLSAARVCLTCHDAFQPALFHHWQKHLHACRLHLHQVNRNFSCHFATPLLLCAKPVYRTHLCGPAWLLLQHQGFQVHPCWGYELLLVCRECAAAASERQLSPACSSQTYAPTSVSSSRPTSSFCGLFSCMHHGILRHCLAC